MPVATRKAKPQAKSYADEDAFEFSDEEISTFDKVFGHTNYVQEPEEPEFGSKAKPKGRKSAGRGKGRKPNINHRKSKHEPTLPDMSDDEDRRASDALDLDDFPVRFDDSEQSFGNSKVVRRSSNNFVTNSAVVTLPEILQIHVDAIDSNGKATINLNLVDLISQNQTPLVMKRKLSQDSAMGISLSTAATDEDETLIEFEEPKHRSKRSKLLHQAKTYTHHTKSKGAGFTDLPYELRVGIYRDVFVKRLPLQFTSKEEFCRSSQFLRTCKLVHEEGRVIMYSENSFHFMRSNLTRGTYFDKDWKEIGWRDVRRFLEDVGPVNLSHLKYVSFFLSDAPPSVTPYLEEEERRCVNDPILHRALKLIGSHALLNKFAMAFQVRRTVMSSDYVFLKALTSIKCHQFNQARRWWSTNRLSYGIMDRLQKVMVSKKEVDDDVDPAKVKASWEPELYLD